MEHFEQLAQESTAPQAKVWQQYMYVDDTFVIWPHSDSNLQQFMNHLNSLRPTIRFTLESEEEGQISFLDVKVKKKSNQLTRGRGKVPVPFTLHDHAMVIAVFVSFPFLMRVTM